MSEIELRRLVLSDYFRNYPELLNLLSPTEDKGFQSFMEQYSKIEMAGNIHIYVIEKNSLIVASGTIIIEDKLIRNNGTVGHIEDIVVDSDNRGLGYGERMVNHLVGIAEVNGCYKVILNCKDGLTSFYERSGFSYNGAEMRKNLNISTS